MERASKGLHKQIRKILKHSYRSQLDLGCGDRELQLSSVYKGIDLPEYNLNEKIQINRKYDLITCIEVIEHLENHSKLIWDIYSHLHDDGIAIITTPNTKNIFSRILFLFRGSLINFIGKDISQHINPVIDNIFTYLCISHGFDIHKKYSNMKIPFLFYLPIRTSWTGNCTIYILKKK